MRDTSNLYGALLHLGGRAASVVEILRAEPLELGEIRSVLGEGWRDDLVAAVSCLFRPERDECRRLLWEAFDRGSWVTPQLAICAMALDPGDFEEVRRRLLLRCATRSDHLQDTDPMWRHVVHGTSAVPTHNRKGMAALIGAYAHVAGGVEWMTAHIPLTDAFWALESDVWDHGERIACDWISSLAPLWLDGPRWLRTPPAEPRRLIALWSLAGQSATVKHLCRGTWSQRVHGLFRGVLESGITACTLEKERLTARTVQGPQLLLELPWPYSGALQDWLLVYAGSNNLHYFDQGFPPAALQLRPLGDTVEIQILADPPDHTRLRLVDQRLEDCPASVMLLGIDAAGRLDGGAAQALSQAAGPRHGEDLSEALAEFGRIPATSFLSSAYALRARRVFELAHIVTRPAPSVPALVHAVERVLEHYRRENYGTLSLPALGCGAGGLQARELAEPLLETLLRADHFYLITIALPRASDREAFEAAARRMRVRFSSVPVPTPL